MSGVGAVKLERYGEVFLKALLEHEAEYGRPDGVPSLPDATLRVSTATGRDRDMGLSATERETLQLARLGLRAEAIARRRGLKTTTIYGHLASCLEEQELTLDQVTDLTPDELKALRDAFEHFAEDAPMALKPVFDAFEGKYDYDVLRCVRASCAAD